MVNREVERLLEAGLLTERRVGQARLIRPGVNSPLAAPVRELLLVSAGPVPLLRAELADVPGVASVFLFGSFAARLSGQHGLAPADIDVMVVGSPDAMAVYDACRRVAEQVHREVNPTIMTQKSWRRRAGSSPRSAPAFWCRSLGTCRGGDPADERSTTGRRRTRAGGPPRAGAGGPAALRLVPRPSRCGTRRPSQRQASAEHVQPRLRRGARRGEGDARRLRLPDQARLRALGRYLAAIFDTPPENAASRHFEQMRRDRHRQRYDARPTTTAAATAASGAAVELHRAGTARV